MILLLDTSIIIDLENGIKNTLEKLESIRGSYPDVPKVSFMTYFEFIDGIRNKQPHNRQKALAFIENFDVLQTTKNTAGILSSLKEKYGDVSFSDLFIAAQAIENNMMLATKDKDFDKIKEINKIII